MQEICMTFQQVWMWQFNLYIYFLIQVIPAIAKTSEPCSIVKFWLTNVIIVMLFQETLYRSVDEKRRKFFRRVKVSTLVFFSCQH